MHGTLNNPTLTARLSLYRSRREEYISDVPFPKEVRVRMRKAVLAEVTEAEAAILKQPDPVARMQSELAFWIDFYERDAQNPTPSDPDEDPETKETEARWAQNSLVGFKRANELLGQGSHAEAFRVLAEMCQDPDRYGPVPGHLDVTGAHWLDLPTELLPPGHQFLDEQSVSV